MPWSCAHMQDQKSGIKEPAGVLPSMMQIADPNRSSATCDPSGSRSLLPQESVAASSLSEISKNQVSREAVLQPNDNPLLSIDRIDPRPLNSSDPALMEICNRLESVFHLARTSQAFSSDEIILFILHHNWG